MQDYTHLQACFERLLALPAVQRGRMVKRTSGDPAEQLREHHDTDDFQAKTQDRIDGAG